MLYSGRGQRSVIIKYTTMWNVCIYTVHLKIKMLLQKAVKLCFFSSFDQNQVPFTCLCLSLKPQLIELVITELLCHLTVITYSWHKSQFACYGVNELFEHSLDTAPQTHTHTPSFHPHSGTCTNSPLSNNVETCSCLQSGPLEVRSKHHGHDRRT